MWRFPKGLASQMIVVLVLALVAAQVFSIVLFVGAREAAVQAVRTREIGLRMESLVRLLTSVPFEIGGDVLDAVNADRSRFRVGPEPSVPVNGEQTRSRLRDDLRHRLEPLGVETVRLSERGNAEIPPWHPPPPRRLVARSQTPGRNVAPDENGRTPPSAPRFDALPRSPDWNLTSENGGRRPPPPPRFGPPPPRHPPPPGDLAASRPPPPVRFATEVTVSALLPSGEWLNAEFCAEQGEPPWSMPGVIRTILAAAVMAAVVFMVRRMSRPLSDLAVAADRLGRGQDAQPLPETGPDEVRRTIRAFNTMTVRLKRFVEGQTRMLAAISHDLKTPITSLRIRTEFVDEGENRDKMLATLDDMQRITEATLAFARDDAAREPSRTVDLVALVESVCDDLRNLGHDVTFAEAPSLPVLCKPNGLRRVVRNLVENAVKYGLRARVAVDTDPDAVRIVIEDDGPGIAAEDQDRVFEPFVRLEKSRSPETGGIRLGMSITRTVIQGHGGDVTLENRPEGGLTVEIMLPRGRDADEAASSSQRASREVAP